MKLTQFELNQIEADVVIVFTNQDNGAVFPLWECEDTIETLHQKAVKLSLDYSEKIGGGITEYEIHDFRETKTQTEQ